MKKITIFGIALLLTEFSFSQTMTVHKNDQTTIDFQLSQIDSITFALQGSSPTQLSENFNDGDYTNNPAWTPNVTSSGCPLGTISVTNGELKAYQTNGSSCGNGAFIKINVDIPLSDSTKIQFDVKPTYSDVAGGAGVQNDEYPAVINLWLATSNGDTVVIRFAYNYRGGASWNRTNYIVVAFPSCQQNVWKRNEQFVIRNYVPNAVKIVRVQAGAQGWNYEGYFDNIMVVN